ncbi:MAG TPA: 16S rRNA (cytosine(1402)-N(4))-methyltransferase RsmH, partial [Lachnospiraceae bacterium]|nr:16S rRNA (cytosine(1402)-N(4))-methyltransferase RsmH [Lachnospiraceae bacterium]
PSAEAGTATFIQPAEAAAKNASAGHLYGVDTDPIEIDKTARRLEAAGYGPDIFTPVHDNFANLAQIAEDAGPFDFILADLGVSSMQIDNPARGFSYKTEGPLDLRMNPEKGISASGRLAFISRDELEGMLTMNSDEPYADKIARTILRLRKKGSSFETTSSLAQAVEEALKDLPENEDKKEIIKKSCQRTFQALRIDVNNEFEVLEQFMENLPDALKSGGRAAVLTFHSGEDRIVKKAFKEFRQQGVYADISGDVVRPTAEECIRNSRAHSAKLRWAVKA